MSGKLLLCLDFDGVIHGYQSGWKGPTVIPDPPVPGAMAFICEASRTFRLAIYSARSGQGGIVAMQAWLEKHMREHFAGEHTQAADILSEIEWPKYKPSAFLTIDDRAITFTGTWPAVAELATFKPWNKP